MCTVVVRWHAGRPVQLLALRDELVGRVFDDPGTWWPDQPQAVGGRDRAAGGTWCVTDVPTGTTALVLNRPERRLASPGAPSRGVLPLLAVRHGARWTEHLDLAGMASFALVLASPELLRCWVYDGTALSTEDLPEGTSMVTSGRAEDGKVARYLPAFAAAAFPDGWRALLQAAEPAPDPASLVVRVEREDEGERKVFATVFGQLLTCAPGRLDLSWSRQPWGPGDWQAW